MIGEFINVKNIDDIIKQEGKDQKDHDINNIPWPFKDNSMEEVFVEGMLERANDVEKFMGELHRLCINGARVHIVVPWHLSSTATKPGCRSRFSLGTFYYFVKGKDITYKGPYFEVIDVKFKHHDKIEKFLDEKWWFRWIISKVGKILNKIGVDKFVTPKVAIGMLISEFNQVMFVELEVKK